LHGFATQRNLPIRKVEQRIGVPIRDQEPGVPCRCKLRRRASLVQLGHAGLIEAEAVSVRPSATMHTASRATRVGSPRSLGQPTYSEGQGTSHPKYQLPASRPGAVPYLHLAADQPNRGPVASGTTASPTNRCRRPRALPLLSRLSEVADHVRPGRLAVPAQHNRRRRHAGSRVCTA
jgi:hypothetical protein